MGWLKTADEVRANPLEDPNTPIAKALMFLGEDRATITGRAMNEGAALSLAAVYNAVALIAGDIGTIPLKVFRRLDNGGRQEESGHPLAELISVSPFDMLTAAAWRESCQGHLLLRGNCYSEILYDGGGRITGLVPHQPQRVTRKGGVYEIRQPGGKTRIVQAADMLHIPGPGGNGIDGWSIITLARENLSLLQALEESNTRFIANAARPSGYLHHPGPLTPEAARHARRQFDEKAGGVSNVGGTPVLDGEWTWTRTSLTAEDTQYITSRKFSVSDVARWFNVPASKIGDLERATFSNVEQQDIDYTKRTLRPWAIRWQAAMNYRLFTERERRAGLFVAFNLEGLQQGDLAARTTAYRQQFEVGAFSPNEIRALENRNPLEGGDRAFIRLDMVPLDRIDQVQSVETDENGNVRKVTYREQRTRREFRSPDKRLGLRAAFALLFLDAAGRMVRGELRNLRRLIKRIADDELRRAIEAYYWDDHPGFAIEVMTPVFRSYAEGMASASATEIDADVRVDTVAHADEYAEVFGTRYSASSRRALIKLETRDAIEAHLLGWADGTPSAQPRHEQVAQRELVRLAESVTRAVFIAGGITQLVWRTVGDSCPFCLRLNGKIVSQVEPFIRKGEEIEGHEGDAPLVPKSDVFGAPAHRGCNCTIIPGG